jgi:prophage regulatory protein
MPTLPVKTSRTRKEYNGIERTTEMKMLREREVKQVTGLSRVTRWRMERRGEFPQKVQLTERCVGYLENEIQDWLKEKAEAR